MIEDTYFDNFTLAQQEAKKQNRFTPYENLQICYYCGEKQPTTLKNLIHLPIDNIINTLIALKTRIPTQLLFADKEMKEHAKEKLEACELKKEQIYQTTIKKIKTTHLNFNEPLRFYISVRYGEKVVATTYETIYNTLIKMGFQVFIDRTDDIKEVGDRQRVMQILNFKPHITININRLRSEYLHDDTLNFIWFQDQTLILYDDTNLNVRDKNYFFYIIDTVKDQLLLKQVPSSKIFQQHIFINEKHFYQDYSIKKTNKIVFIGNNYFSLYPTHIVNSIQLQPIKQLMRRLFRKHKLTNKKLQRITQYAYNQKLVTSKEHIDMFLFPAIVREEVVKWLCTQVKQPVEIYGLGWETINEVQPFYKGLLHTTKDVAKKFQSATHSLSVHPIFYYQLRVMEASACNCISIVYDGINNKEELIHKKNMLLFSTKKELLESLQLTPTKSCMEISQQINARQFVQKILKIINQNITN